MKQKDFSKQNDKLLDKVISDPKYNGFHVVIVGGEVHTAKTGQGASKILKGEMEKFPHDVPATAFFPKADSLILWH